MITLELIPDEELTVRTAVGAIDGDELREAIRSYYEDREYTRHILWDFVNADVSAVSAEDIREAVDLSKGFGHLRPGGRTAMLVSDNLAFGLGRMFSSHQETPDSSLSHRVFRDRDEALEWLKKGDP